MNIINTYRRTVPTFQNGVMGAHVTITDVLTQDACGHYAVYRGIGDNYLIASQGAKLSEKEALTSFDFPADKYRL